MLTVERLKELFSYDQNTGLFYRINPRKKENIGKPAGTPDKDGYLSIQVDRRCYRAHRLAWLYVHGEFPSAEIDHINRVKTDNRIENLRDVTRAQNGQNRPMLKSNTSGFRGVYWNKKMKKWHSQIKLMGKRYHLGLFECAEEASAAYKAAAIKMHTHTPIKEGLE